MKTPAPSKLAPTTVKIISAALAADPGATPAHRRMILDACQNAPIPSPPPSAPTGKLYSASEAAAVCGVTLAGLLKWIRSGQLEAQPVGKRSFVVSAEAIDRFLDTRNPTPKSAADLPDRLLHLEHVVQRAQCHRTPMKH